jgi:hypothetical protein
VGRDQDAAATGGVAGSEGIGGFQVEGFEGGLGLPSTAGGLHLCAPSTAVSGWIAERANGGDRWSSFHGMCKNRSRISGPLSR